MLTDGVTGGTAVTVTDVDAVAGTEHTELLVSVQLTTSPLTGL